jgi:hypothetical protein
MGVYAEAKNPSSDRVAWRTPSQSLPYPGLHQRSIGGSFRHSHTSGAYGEHCRPKVGLPGAQEPKACKRIDLHIILAQRRIAKLVKRLFSCMVGV